MHSSNHSEKKKKEQKEQDNFPYNCIILTLKTKIRYILSAIMKSLYILLIGIICFTKVIGQITLSPSNKGERNRNEIDNQLIVPSITTQTLQGSKLDGPRLLQPTTNSELNKKNLFKPEKEWKVIGENDILPRDGLDIRINMETGLKEAKLSDSKVSDITTDSAYSFSTQFKEVYELVSNNDYNNALLKLDDLLEFVHDYKYGQEIITHEWASLSKLMMDEQLPANLNEIITRVVISAMRNNPPVIDYIRDHSADSLVTKLFSKVELCDDFILLKRYVTFLEQFLDPKQITSQNLNILYSIFNRSSDKQLKWKILHIVSYFYTHGQFMDLEHDSLWFKHYLAMIEDSAADEYHIRLFFDTLYDIKSHYENNIQVPSSFLNWLNNQIQIRENINDLSERDPEQIEFNDRLKESRHNVFGNPMAGRIKHFNDEL